MSLVISHCARSVSSAVSVVVVFSGMPISLSLIASGRVFIHDGQQIDDDDDDDNDDNDDDTHVKITGKLPTYVVSKFKQCHSI